MTFYLVDVLIDDEAKENYNALVHVFSMKNNILTEAVNYQVGQKITMRLTNWIDVYDTFDSINRSEINNEELMIKKGLLTESEKNTVQKGWPSARECPKGLSTLY